MEKMNRVLLGSVLLFFAGCKAPTVNLATSEPIRVDINMRLDVYQHQPQGTKPSVAQAAPSDNPETARRNRMADIQQFKNSRLVGENHDGLLTVRVDTPGDYGDYVRKTVTAENADRMSLMKAEAERDKRNLADVQARQAEIWRKRSFKDEWIEVPGENGDWTWRQKE